MPNKHYALVGRVVRRTIRPRFTITFREQWGGFNVNWIDDPVLDADYLARLMREAGEFFRAHVRTDWVQQIVAARARELGMTAYRIAKETGGAVSQDHVQDYLTGKKSMGSHKLQHVLRVLKLDVVSLRE